MSNKDKKTAPVNACIFAEQNNVCFAESSDDERGTFKIVAYSGGIIRGHWWWGNLAFDLKGLKFAKKKTPVLQEHLGNIRLGFSTRQDIDEKVIVEGIFLSNPAAQELKQDIKDGFPMEASMLLPPEIIEYVKEGSSVEVNGRTLKGPGAVFRKAVIKDVSMCVFGADSNTQSKVFAEGGKDQVSFNLIEKEQIMETQELKVETFAADYPELHKQITADARDEGKKEGTKEASERFAKFAERFGDDHPAFCIEQLKAGVTLVAATDAYAKKLKGDLDKANEAARTAAAQAATRIDPAHAEFTDNQAAAGPAKVQKPEEKYTDEFNGSEDIQREFGADGLANYIAYRKADDAGQVKISKR